MLKRSVLGLAVITGLCSVQASLAAEFYRYVNDKGVTVLDRLGVPPEYIEKGYQVVDDQGRPALGYGLVFVAGQAVVVEDHGVEGDLRCGLDDGGGRQ